jgi:transposase
MLPLQYIKPYVKRGKNDAHDAEAICEAMSRPGMRFSGEAGRDTALLWGSAPRPLAAHEAEGSYHFRTHVIAG